MGENKVGIITRRLNISQVEREDIKDLAKVMSHPQVLKMAHQSRLGMIASRPFMRFLTKVPYFVIHERASDVLVGIIGLAPKEPNKISEIGYDLLPEWWGKGMATEAVEAVVDWGFQNLSIEEIVARVHPSNIGSQSVLNKNGFIHDQDTSRFQHYTLTRKKWEQFGVVPKNLIA